MVPESARQAALTAMADANIASLLAGQRKSEMNLLIFYDLSDAPENPDSDAYAIGYPI